MVKQNALDKTENTNFIQLEKMCYVYLKLKKNNKVHRIDVLGSVDLNKYNIPLLIREIFAGLWYVFRHYISNS